VQDVCEGAGVLVDTEADGHRVAFNDAFKQKGALGARCKFLRQSCKAWAGQTTVHAMQAYHSTAPHWCSLLHFEEHSQSFATSLPHARPCRPTTLQPHIGVHCCISKNTHSPSLQAYHTSGHAEGLNHLRVRAAGYHTQSVFAAGLDHEWSLELYGKLLEIGGGKERMTAYFTVRRSQALPPLSALWGDV